MLPPRDEVLTEIEAEAAKRKIPIVGPAVGRILYQLAPDDRRQDRIRDWARRSGTRPSGGPALWAKAAESSTPTATARRRTKRAAISTAPVSSRQNHLNTGDALELLSEEKQQFDIIFNDVDKEDYPRVFKLVRAAPAQRRPVRDRQRLMERKSSAETIRPRPRPKRSWNSIACSTARRILFTTILPIRDGVAVAIKK